MIRIRFCTEGDKLDEKIAKTQYGFWATHVEAIFPSGEALRFDDERDGWYLTNAEDYWVKQVIVDVKKYGVVKDRGFVAARFYEFLGKQIGRGYDIRPLAGVKCDLDNHDGLRWSCADLIHRALVAAGIFDEPPRDLQFITARDLMLMLSALGPLPAIQTRTPPCSPPCGED